VTLFESCHPIGEDGTGVTAGELELVFDVLACTKHVGDATLFEII